jgi:hypothetical protein
MKTIHTLILIFLLFSGKLFTQNIEWAVRDSSINAYGKNLLCDKDSNIYIYGKSYNGSFIEKFTTQGTFLLFKKWQGFSFFIQKIIYDGDQFFYFTGNFSNSCTVDGITIISKGGTDGMIGKMNRNGTILWIKTFGSGKEEMGNGVCFGPSKNSLILTGSITDSLIVDNIFVDRMNQQSMLVGQFSLNGTLQNHKLIDLLPQRDNVFDGVPGMENIGREICSGTNGNYFILADREGRHPPCCSYDTISASLEGRYVMKLNSSFDTLWTKYITGTQCYYGWDSHSLRVSTAGDPYIISHCSGKYGGDGFIQRLNQNTGAVNWSEDHADGGYSDIFLDGNILFTCGTDSANYCPCPDSNIGYQDVKKFDQSNVMLEILKFNKPQYTNHHMYFRSITRDNYGNTFIEGVFNDTYIVFGNDTLRGDSIDAFSYQGDFLLKIGTNCQPPNQPTAILGNNDLCSGTSNTYSVVPVNGATSYIWSLPTGWTGTSTTNSISALTNTISGNITVKIQNSCGSSVAQTLSVSVKAIPSTPISIYGNTSVCSGSSNTYSVSVVSGATSYSWSLPGGWTGTSATNSISTTANTTSGDIMVNASNSCGSSSVQSLAIIVNTIPATPATISGNSTICSGTSNTYSVATVNGATSYIWTLPGGWTGSSTSSNIAVTASAINGNIKVKAINSCGSSSVQSLAVIVKTIPATPGIINGNTTICSGSTNPYSVSVVSGATSYVWTLPSGWTGSSTTNSISTTANSTSGSITVKAINSCGSSVAQTFSVTSKITPSTPTISQAGLILTSSSVSGNQWYRNGTLIAGSTAQTHSVIANGTYNVKVTVSGCTSALSASVSVINVGINEISNPYLFAIYPNPNEGTFDITFKSSEISTYKLELYNALGQLIFKDELDDFTGQYTKKINVAEYGKGIYSFSLSNSKNETVKKIVVY